MNPCQGPQGKTGLNTDTGLQKFDIEDSTWVQTRQKIWGPEWGQDAAEKSSEENHCWRGGATQTKWLLEACTFELQLYGREAARPIGEVSDGRAEAGVVIQPRLCLATVY